MRGTRRRNCAQVLIVAIAMALPWAAGCGGRGGAFEPMWTWRSPELLYLLSKPCDRLYVEVDTVEGVEPPAEALACLSEVLSEFCDKPAGIRLARGKPIPLGQAAGKSPRLLGLLNIDGPPEDEAADRTAYLYVLFFDSRQLALRDVQNPQVDRYYPCAIYLDMAYWPRIARHLRRQIIAHELGHVLGLCKNAGHGDGLHRRNANCVMSARVSVPLQTWLFGVAPPADLHAAFCSDCLADLQAARGKAPDPRLSFCGPMLVRREADYSVGFLPGCVKLWFGRDRQLDWRRVRPQLMALARARGRELQDEATSLYMRDAPATLSDRAPAVGRATRDVNPLVAQIAAGLLER